MRESDPARLRPSTPCGLAAMFALEGSSCGEWQPGEMGSILRHQLASPLEPVGTDPGTPAGRGAPRSFGEVLSDPHPPLGLLLGIRDFAVAHCAEATSGLPPAVAVALYVSAVCAALVRLGRRIAPRADALVEGKARWVLGQAWLTPELRQLVERGVECWAQDTCVSGASRAAADGGGAASCETTRDEPHFPGAA